MIVNVLEQCKTLKSKVLIRFSSNEDDWQPTTNPAQQKQHVLWAITAFFGLVLGYGISATASIPQADIRLLKTDTLIQHKEFLATIQPSYNYDFTQPLIIDNLLPPPKHTQNSYHALSKTLEQPPTW